MEVRQAILSRRTVQRYSTDPIPDGCIERALECAIRAPNHKLTNPWRFARVGPETRERIVEIGLRIKRDKAAAKGRELSEGQEAMIRAKLGNSAEVLVVSQVLVDDDFRRKEDYASIACAIQNLMLSLWSEGVGSKWATGSVTRHPDTYEAVDIDPDTEEIVGFVWVGHSSAELIEPPRRPLDEIYRRLP
jgi:nitroreductase